MSKSSHSNKDQIEKNAAHDHIHGVIDPTLTTTARGIWAVKVSFIGLMLTAIMQVVIVYFTGSVALLADTVHNFGDATTAIPLWIAFRLARRKPSKRFTYGYGRVEDLAGTIIVLIILVSAIVSGYQSIARFINPQGVQYLGAVAIASLLGFIGNEAVAIFRIRVGREIESAALVADGYHARIDGLTSLGVLFSVIGLWLGFPLADPIVGLIITIAILRIVWESSKMVFSRLLDGVDPEVVVEIRHAASHCPSVLDVTNVRARWLGHRLHAEVNVTVSERLSVTEGHNVALQVRHEILHHLSYLSNVIVHIDPADASGEEFHCIQEHAHGTFGPHTHP